MSQPIFADVALNARLRPGSSPVLTYRVPPQLRGLVVPGQLVWAPLRRRQVQGVVLALRAHAEGTTRDLDGLGDAEALLTPLQLRLADWLSAHYRVGLYDVLQLMLPPGSSQEAETTWRPSSAGLSVDLGSLPERERAILYYLRLNGESSEKALRAALRGGDELLRDAYASLLERGLTVRGSATSAPKARPRQVRTVRLLVTADALPQALAALKRAPRQAAVVEYLAAIAVGAQTSLVLRQVLDATGASGEMLRELERRGYLAIEQHEVRRDPLAGDDATPDRPPTLTAQQQAAFAAVREALDAGQHQVFLLHGVTGSGKTELYLRAIGRALRGGRQALVLVPEIALTAQLVRRFAARFPGQLAVLHSQLSLGERYDEWRRLRRGDARIAIGSRSAAFAPLPDLGLIIVDEEHEPSYKHDQSPRYQARDVALELARLADAPIVLGSATPAVESYERARSGVYRLLEMPERVGTAISVGGVDVAQPLPLPIVQLVDMRKELGRGNRSIFSAPLQEALADALERGEQALLFLNRRGAAAFVMCRDCGHVLGCPRCSSPLTVHLEEQPQRARADGPAASAQPSLLVCHTCNYRELVPGHCPQCWSARIRHFGVGTQRVVEEVERLFPQARALRWDKDTASGKDGNKKLLDRFLRREADVMVGTQMIAKGLDIPGITVVGVVAADTGLRLPDFRASERTFQLLTQVAGRAGRRDTVGRVVIQSYSPDHYALRAAQEHDYHAFFAQELAFRRQLGYPPFARLVRFVISGPRDERLEREAKKLAAQVAELAPQLNLGDWSLVGPAPCFFHRMRGRFRWHLLLRAERPVPLLDALGPLPGWIVDVDPVSLL
jgi:primosomal protein N' (replication factor Y) (superfamily II helicase)